MSVVNKLVLVVNKLVSVVNKLVRNTDGIILSGNPEDFREIYVVSVVNKLVLVVNKLVLMVNKLVRNTDGIILQGNPEDFRENPISVPLDATNTPHRPTRNSTWSSAEGGRRLAACLRYGTAVITFHTHLLETEKVITA